MRSVTPRHRPAERDMRIDHHGPRFVWFPLARERIEPDGQALHVSLDATEVCRGDLSHGELTRPAEIDHRASLLDEEIEAIGLELVLAERVSGVILPLEEVHRGANLMESDTLLPLEAA